MRLELITSPWWPLISTVLGIAIGGFITWCVSKKHYLDASRKSKENVSKITKTNKLVAEFLQTTLGTKEAALVFDNEANPIVLQKYGSAVLHATSNIKANAIVIDHNKQEK